jgi:cytosine/adenosine deaminase-related metal-dependent hydrolase
MITRVTARWVLAYSAKCDDHVLIDDGEVIVDGDRIASVGPRTSWRDNAAVERTIELGECLLTPGLIDLDALSDIDHAILDSWWAPQQLPAQAWSSEYASGTPTHVFDAQERARIREYAFVQLLLRGVTTAMPISSEVHSDWAESFDDAVALATVASRLGLRLYAGPSYRSAVPSTAPDGRRELIWKEEKGREGFADAVRFVEWAQATADPLITGVLLPCRVETVSTELLEQTSAAARRLGTLVRIHALQGLAERADIADRADVTPLRLLEQVGLVGPDVLIPHAIYTDVNPETAAFDVANGLQPQGTADGDLGTLARTGTTVIHCALTSLRYSHALRTFGAYRAAGVRIALGTDSFPPDLIRSMDVGVGLAKLLTGRLDGRASDDGDCTTTTAGIADYFRAATLGGAAALGRPDLGRIAPGAQADLVAFSLDDLRDGPIDDPVRTLVTNGSGLSTRYSMIAGRTVVENGTLQGLDEDALRTEAQALFARMRAGYATRSHIPSTPGELFPPTFARASG